MLDTTLQNLLKNPANTVVSLQNKKLTTNDLGKVAECISANPNLTELNLSNNEINDIPDSFIAAVKKHPRLTKVNLGENIETYTYTDDPGAWGYRTGSAKLVMEKTKLSEKLTNFYSLLQTKRSVFELTEEQMQNGLNSLLSNLTNLEELYFSQFNVPVSQQELISFIMKLPKLKVLELRNSHITNDQLKLLADWLQTNDTLKKLDLRGNTFSKKVLGELTKALKTNLTITELLIDEPPKTLLAILKRNQCYLSICQQLATKKKSISLFKNCLSLFEKLYDIPDELYKLKVIDDLDRRYDQLVHDFFSKWWPTNPTNYEDAIIVTNGLADSPQTKELQYKIYTDYVDHLLNTDKIQLALKVAMRAKSQEIHNAQQFVIKAANAYIEDRFKEIERAPNPYWKRGYCSDILFTVSKCALTQSEAVEKCQEILCQIVKHYIQNPEERHKIDLSDSLISVYKKSQDTTLIVTNFKEAIAEIRSQVLAIQHPWSPIKLTEDSPCLKQLTDELESCTTIFKLHEALNKFYRGSEKQRTYSTLRNKLQPCLDQIGRLVVKCKSEGNSIPSALPLEEDKDQTNISEQEELATPGAVEIMPQILAKYTPSAPPLEEDEKQTVEALTTEPTELPFVNELSAPPQPASSVIRTPIFWPQVPKEQPLASFSEVSKHDLCEEQAKPTKTLVLESC